MSKHGLRRAAVSIAVAVGVAAFYSAPAFGAEKPTITNAKSLLSTWHLTDVTAQGTINPNGASTTYKVEYGPTTSYGSSTKVVGIGSGTSGVSVSSVVTGLNTMSVYHMRLSATNSYGTVTSGDIPVETAIWFNETIEWPSTYSSHGSFTFDFPSLNATLNCEENGYGVIGHELGVKNVEEINSTFSNCSFAQNPKCQVYPFSMHLSGAMKSVEVVLVRIEVSETCPWFSITEVVAGPGFDTTVGTNPLAFLPVGMVENDAHFGENQVVVTGSSTWSLTGKYKGKAFSRGTL